MATATHASPMGLDQLNTTLYVFSGTGAGFNTIQAAVDFARVHTGGMGEIVVVYGHPDGESIGTIIGGTATILILDERHGADQRWTWNGANYVPQTFTQLGDVTSKKKIRAYGFSPTDSTASNVMLGVGGDGTTPTFSLINASAPTNQKTWLFGANTNQLYFSATADNGQDNSFLLVNRSAGAATSILIVPPVTFEGAITAPDAAFVTCEVDGSPVRTFANTPSGSMVYPGAGIGVSTGSAWAASIDPATLVKMSPSVNTGHLSVTGNFIGAGMAIGPPIGNTTTAGAIISSAGQTLTLAGTNPANNRATITFQGNYGGTISNLFEFGTDVGNNGTKDFYIVSAHGFPMLIDANDNVTFGGSVSASGMVSAGSPVRTFANTPSGSMVYPGAGIGVSTGSAWGASIDPATIPRLAATNTFTAANSFTGGIASSGGALYVGGGAQVDLGSDAYIEATSTPGRNVGYAAILGGPGLASFDWLESSNLGVGWSAQMRTTGSWFLLDRAIAADAIEVQSGAGNPVIINKPLSVGGDISATGQVTSHGLIALSPGNGDALTGAPASSLRAVWGNGGVHGFIDATGPDDLNFGIIAFRVASSIPDTIKEVFFMTSSDVQCAVPLIVNGDTEMEANLHVVGTISAGTKTFAIAHPFDEKKELIHACLEGPENGVFYRGETLTLEGRAEVSLPAYFEALTYTDDRSVLLTQLIYRDGQKLSTLGASRIKEGKFTIYSSEPSVVVAWEVKAVRRIGVDGKLAVEIEKRKPLREAA